MDTRINTAYSLHPWFDKGNRSKYEDISVEKRLTDLDRTLNQEGTPTMEAGKAKSLLTLAKRKLEQGNSIDAKRIVQEAKKILKPYGEILGKQRSDDNTVIHNPFKKEPISIYRATEKADSKRNYQDVSQDADVSFQYPTALTSAQSFLAVPAHERQHVANSISEAIFEGKNVQTIVSYKLRFDPHTGKPYLAGGTTRTIHLPHFEINTKEDFLGKNLDVIG